MGVPIGDRNWKGQTALIFAAESNLADIVKMLLDDGARIVLDKGGRSPLHYPAMRNNRRPLKSCLQRVLTPLPRRTEGIRLQRLLWTRAMTKWRR